MARILVIEGTCMLALLLQCSYISEDIALSHSPETNCPPLNVSDSLHNHSSLEDFARQWTNHTLFQVVCTEPNTTNLTGHWDYDTGPLGRHNSTNISSTDQSSICTNFSLQLINVSFAASDGLYTLTVSSDCGSHANRTFSLSVSGCSCDNPPEPHLSCHAPAFVAESRTPKNLSLLSASFRGCADATAYDAVVWVNNTHTAICSDDTVLHGNYKCTRKKKYECLFTLEVIAVGYGQNNSGQYCTHSRSQDGGSHSNSACFQTEVLPWPTVTGPSNNVTIRLRGITVSTLIWEVNNFYPAVLVTAYKDKTKVVKTRTEPIPNTADTFVFIDVKTSGLYQLYINFNGSVDTEGTGFHAVYSNPGYAHYSAGLLAAVIVSPITIAIICCVCIVALYRLYKYCWRKKKGYNLVSGVVANMEFTLSSAPNDDPLSFTLTCTGGPATTVTWTSPAGVSGIESQSVIDQSIVTYTLTVTGRHTGDYMCTMYNARTVSPVTKSLTVTAASPPTELRATKNDTTIKVDWTPPSSTPTGYIIYYEATDDSGSVPVTDGKTHMYNITDRYCNSYSITIVATSLHLPSTVVGPVTVIHIPTPQPKSLTSPPEFKDLMEEVAVHLPRKWSELATMLGLKPNKITHIEVLADKIPNNCYREVFNEWKNNTPTPYCWETVVKALKSNLVYEPGLASSIESRIQSSST